MNPGLKLAALKSLEYLNSKEALFYPNGSCYIIKDTGYQIGTKGQTKLKVVFDELGNIWTAVPIN